MAIATLVGEIYNVMNQLLQVYLLAKFGGHRSYGNVDISSYIISYINTSKKVDLAALVHHIERFSKSVILIFNFVLQDAAGRKTRKT